MTWTTHVDAGPTGWQAGAYDLTRVDTGEVNPRRLQSLPGACGEHLAFQRSGTGNKTRQEWQALLDELDQNGMRYAITVHKEADGQVVIYEGNHRLRAALALGWQRVPVEIKYFGNSQRNGLVIDPSSLP